jgi:hypothetical protein
MKRWFFLLLLGGSLGACQSNDSTQNIRDNENRVATPDVTNNHPMKDTTAVIDSSQIH